MGSVFGIVGFSGSGKTTLTEQLIACFAARGLRVNAIKHSHHDLELEPPGKDSARFRSAGAAEVLVASPYRFAIVHELRGAPEPTLAEQLARLSPADLTLVEGFKHDPIPKLEVWRAETGKPQLFPGDPSIVAVASDHPVETALPFLDLDDADTIADFITHHLALNPHADR
ncbi:molybdopterin-guanine dinucleotide biosynthesis protein B [Jeongeupia naejangsanensis]|uniref:Molybdopterin-guanine dinucleotide biosynthesis protein B n=1 Tax=Jeongeupia naejangsanensis TaxID=613195 RepID=A0ABS2BJZ2_9NEIS|nr:molybdopterin-guanine dinucleotide biosynthesis protein B [Jeongeupia naejangsanensis]MBM3115932.1 molybdopterin-guanine dinucleotide biosynthesis protein B [Jeongeupia naejangsanensis]